MASVVIVSCQADTGWAGKQIAAGLRHGLGWVRSLEQFSDPHQYLALLHDADVAIVVIGPSWHTLPAGTPGIDAMRYALDYLLRGDRPRLIVPLLVQGAVMPPANALPLGLQSLTFVQAVTLDAEPTHEGMKQLRARIRTYRKDVVKAAHSKGNYFWFKIISFLPAALILFDSFIRFASADVHNSTIAQGGMVFSDIIFYVYVFAFVAMWVSSVVVAVLVRRFGWLVANILYVPAFIFPGILYAAIPGVPLGLKAFLIFLTIVLLIYAMLLHPIMFGLALPPFRKKNDGV